MPTASRPTASHPTASRRTGPRPGPTGRQDDAADPRLAALVARLAPGCVIGGRAAARLYEQRVAVDGLAVFHPGAWRSYHDMWHGATGETQAAGAEAILVCAPTGARLRTNGPALVRVTGPVRVLRGELPPEDTATVAGVPVTSPARTAFDLARFSRSTDAVVALDRLLRLGVVEREDVRRLALARRGWRGRPAALRALGRTEENAARPEESVLRMLWLDAGLPRPRSRALVTDRDRRVVARPDLVDPDAGVVAILDDTSADQQTLEGLGLAVVRVSRADLCSARGAEALQATLRRAYRRARSRGSTPRLWFVEPG